MKHAISVPALCAILAGVLSILPNGWAEENPGAHLNAILRQWEAEKAPDNAKAESVVKALVALGPGAVDDMVKALPQSADKKPLATGVIITALLRLKASQASKVLATLAVSSGSLSVQRNALNALAAIGGPEAMPILLPAVLKELPEDLNQKDKWRERDEWLKSRDALVGAISRMCAEADCCTAAAQEILSLRPSASAPARARFADALAGAKFGMAEDVLVSLAYDADPTVQMAAVRALGVTGSPGIVRRIGQLIGHPDPKVQVAVCFALGKAKSVEAVPLLLGVLESKAADVPATAQWALTNITGMQFTEARRWQAWVAAEQKRSLKLLAELLQQARSGPPETAPLALEQIGALVLARDKVVDELRPFLSSNDPRICSAAINVIAQSNDPRAPALLLAKLGDRVPVVNYSAWRGLRFITHENLPPDRNLWAALLAGKG